MTACRDQTQISSEWRATWLTLYEHELYAVVYSLLVPLNQQQSRLPPCKTFLFLYYKMDPNACPRFDARSRPIRRLPIVRPASASYSKPACNGSPSGRGKKKELQKMDFPTLHPHRLHAWAAKMDHQWSPRGGAAQDSRDQQPDSGATSPGDHPDVRRPASTSRSRTAAGGRSPERKRGKHQIGFLNPKQENETPSGLVCKAEPLMYAAKPEFTFNLLTRVLPRDNDDPVTGKDALFILLGDLHV
ncbi:uncharacterized protein LOC133407965 [Phycodurus eques]|uniref:uncharacterized protein LOC133407965 n=1 Tax=Phycodurus eques TaxID=693459 RepID=UPI002ACE5ACF|nr:uncharacterized protein LOC133407965 [Phycodurus eques]